MVRLTLFNGLRIHLNPKHLAYTQNRMSQPRTNYGTLSSLNITFLGTASAQPSSTRNHSALALRLSGDVWLFDCGEATQHQIQRCGVKMGKIEKIFITHTHGDHIFGLLPLMAGRLNGAGGMSDGFEDPRAKGLLTQNPLEIYGPPGTRAYVRNGLHFTHTQLGSPYIVHELRSPSDPPTGDYTNLPPLPSEYPGGRNIQKVNGVWPDIFINDLISISAAPIRHSVPCLGFVVTELPVPGKIDPKKYIPEIKRTGTPLSVMRRLQMGESVLLSDGITFLHGPPRRPGRKIVILGDTYDPSAIANLAANPDLLIHEATNAHLPGIDPQTKDEDTFETVERRTKSRGHSTPQMAGAFAARIGARKLILNHFSARYAGSEDESSEDGIIMKAISNLAAEKFTGEVICARDFMSVDIELHQ